MELANEQKQNLFRNIFVEKDAKDYPLTIEIVKKLRRKPIEIENLNDVFGTVDKPFGKEKLDLFLATKKGKLVKEAPAAYGLSQDKKDRHYYFFHCFNCIYHCHYCYLQGYFNSPDMVVFVNRQDVFEAVEEVIKQSKIKKERPFFYSGEFSDSLALSELTNEVYDYIDFFSKQPNGHLELRTKSVRISQLLSYAKKKLPPSNVVVAYSLAPEKSIARYEEKTPSLKARLSALEKLVTTKYHVALHFDPIIYDQDTDIAESYGELMDRIASIPGILPKIKYISLGTLRFTSNAYRKIKKNHFLSPMFTTPMQRFSNNMKQYDQKLRQTIFGQLEKIIAKHHFPSSKVYRSMEEK